MPRFSFFALAILTACGGSNSGGGNGSGVDAAGGGGTDHLACIYPKDVPGPGTKCAALKGAKAQQISDFRAECVSVNGTVSDACPSADLIGCCSTPVPNLYTMEGCDYTDTGENPTDSAAACTEQGGTYTTTP